MKQEMTIADGRRAATMNDNQNMTEPPASPAWGEPFAKRSWAELRYALVTLPLAIAAVAFIVPMLCFAFVAIYGYGWPRLSKAGSPRGQRVLHGSP